MFLIKAALRGTLRTDSRTTCSQVVDVTDRLAVRRTSPLLEECYPSTDSGTLHELVSRTCSTAETGYSSATIWKSGNLDYFA